MHAHITKMCAKSQIQWRTWTLNRMEFSNLHQVHGFYTVCYIIGRWHCSITSDTCGWIALCRSIVCLLLLKDPLKDCNVIAAYWLRFLHSMLAGLRLPKLMIACCNDFAAFDKRYRSFVGVFVGVVFANFSSANFIVHIPIDRLYHRHAQLWLSQSINEFSQMLCAYGVHRKLQVPFHFPIPLTLLISLLLIATNRAKAASPVWFDGRRETTLENHL